MKPVMQCALPPTDADIRLALRVRLLNEQAVRANSVVLEELGVQRGEARIDLVLVNGKIHGYEIKSDRDSLRRLHGQIERYNKVLDRVTLVAGARHLETAATLIPDWWGLLLVGGNAEALQLKAIRRARNNPAKDARVLAEFLWLEEAVALLARHGLDRGVRSKPRSVVWDRIAERLKIEIIAAAVRDSLKSRAELAALP